MAIDKEAIEMVTEERMVKVMKEYKEEIREMKEEIEKLKRKVYRLEQCSGKRKRNEKERERVRRKIVRVEKKRWGGGSSNLNKVKQLFTDGLKVKAEVKEVNQIGHRGDWITILVKMGSEKDSRKVLEARRKEGSRMKVKIDADKSVEDRIKEGKEREKRKERKEEESGGTRKSAEDEIVEKMEDHLLMSTDEDEAEQKKKREGRS
ncbi:RNA-binding protein 25-like [Temnothorax curvispinosus]|uniref:RNA-binding protein 25-like n=1 Tax=Temnothorax curvispinosus TaxID=300111 RepID=A0A6J1PDI7_9HYME|nr:RNA-binding protein 25-like [Temnothorax curvispinosus]